MQPLTEAPPPTAAAYHPSPGRHDPADVPLKVAIEHPEKVGHPDGVPHDIIGLAAYLSILLAGASLIAWLVVGVWLAVAIMVLGVFLIMRNLPKRARRERREEAIDAATHNWKDPPPTP